MKVSNLGLFAVVALAVSIVAFPALAAVAPAQRGR